MRHILAELAGLFVDDGALAALALAWVGLCWAVLPLLVGPLAIAALLVAGLMGVLGLSVLRA